MNYSTLPYGNNVQISTPPPPPPPPARLHSRHNSTSSMSSAYGTITKAGARYIINNYDQTATMAMVPGQVAPPPEDPEWSYAASRQQFVIANNLQNASSISSSPVPSSQDPYGHFNNVTLNHANSPHAIYIQNNSSNVSSYGRASPYNNLSLSRRSPLPPQQQQQQQSYETTTNTTGTVPRPNNNNAAVIKQLQEKFNNGNNTVLNNSCSPSCSPRPMLDENSSARIQQQQQVSLRRITTSQGANVIINNSRNELDSAVEVIVAENKDSNVEIPQQQQQQQHRPTNMRMESGPPPAGQQQPPPLAQSPPQYLERSDGIRGSNSHFKSAWIHCRLPLLIVFVVILLLLFLSFSGALIYFKYFPFLNLPNALEDEPCDEDTCDFGASCFMEDGRSRCRCPESCSMDKSPVCGTDGVTYINECLLRQLTCQHQNSIRIRHPGPCDMPDPCADKACLFGSRCVASADGLYATCECPTSCPSYGDSEGSQPVCGSDGKYYRNKCELDREACRLRRNITARFFGKCDPCEEISCPAPQVCQLDGERRPVCRCNEMCSMDFNPVCGSDGKTYSNECVMRQEACRARRELRVIYRGKCSSGTNPCASRTCRGYESCVINKFGIAGCACAMKCDPVVSPVCGSDGRTYDSHCDLTHSACRDGRTLTVAYKGTCEGGSACSGHVCPSGSTCVEKSKGQAVCECPTCGADYDPVCGSDGVSYQNECRLRMEACLTNNHQVHVLYPGLCNGCDRKQCDFYAICKYNPDTSETRCECPLNCTNEISLVGTPVCGTDGVTYANECDLRMAACRQQKFVVVASKGHCDLCSSVQCKFGAKCEDGICVCPTNCPEKKDPVCGSDLKTYGNECELQRISCTMGKELTVHFYGECSEGLSPQLGVGSVATSSGSLLSGNPSVTFTETVGGGGVGSENGGERPKMCEAIRCDFGAVCELGEDGFPRCTCQFNCSTAAGSPVCGSDLKLYANDCEMRREGCHRQKELRPRPMELCEETEVRPCHGDEPLKHEDTGEDINCGSGPSRTNCPTGSYCHRSSSFAKCCKKPKERTTTRRPMPLPQPKCEESIHGCCPDGVTAAMGEEHAGCPSVCKCNKLGSIAETCDPFTQECQCRPGVGSPKCDRCLPGFWGLSRIAVDGHLGCRECGCSKFGSVRDDCEQMSGRCVCKPGVLGHKCDSCAEGEFLGPYGCTSDPVNIGRNCDEVVCGYGAECEQDGNRAGCICNLQCSDTNDIEEVCASDGFTYESECQVRLQSCRSQRAIWVAHKGPCLDSSESDGTESPVRRWTGLHYTEPGDDGMDPIIGESARSNSDIWADQMATGFSSSYSSFPTGTGFSGGMKSTRDLPPQSNYYDDESLRNSNSHHHHPFPTTSSTIQMRSYLGDSCQSSGDCMTAHSTCLAGWCICKEGYYEDGDRVHCKQINSHLSGGISACNSAPCELPASCWDHRNGTYSCLCPLGTIGTGCAVKEEKAFPFLNGRSTITMGKLGGYQQLSLELEITPYLNYAHGILIFASQHGNGSGDFMSVALLDGYVEFRYDLGDGVGILRSTNRVQAGVAYHIVAKRYNRDGLLRIAGDEEVKGASPGTMKSLNLGHESYIGYVPVNSTKIWELAGTSEGFVGCIHKVRVGRRSVGFSTKEPFVSSVKDVFQCPVVGLLSPHGFTTPMYESEDDFFPELYSNGGAISSTTYNSKRHELPDVVSVCSIRNPCHHHGHCWNDRNSLNGYRCVCHPEFSGKHCETRITNSGESGAVLDFRGMTFLELPKIENGGRHVRIELWLMVRSTDGLILYNGQDGNKGDFLAIFMSSSHLVFMYDLGSGIANLTWSRPLSLHKWHWVVASREGREGKLQVDGMSPQTGRSPPSLSELNLELPLYFGGVSDRGQLHKDIPGLPDFDGALQRLKINGQNYYKEINSALTSRTVHRYEGPPCGSSVSPPCANGGTCLPRLDSYFCACKGQFSGSTCEERKSTPGAIRFDGQNYFEFPRKTQKQESPLNSTEYDDDEFYSDHLDSQMDELFSETEVQFGEMANEDSDPDNEFVPLIEQKLVEGSTAQLRNRIEMVFRTNTASSGVILWTGSSLHDRAAPVPPSESNPHRKGYLGLFIADGFLELRIDLDLSKSDEQPVIIRSKAKVNDNRWHQVLIARRGKSIVMQVDGLEPTKTTLSHGSTVLVTNGRYWIGGVAGSVLPSNIPPLYHQGFVGCVDLVRMEKRRLPLSKLAYETGIPFCEDDDDFP